MELATKVVMRERKIKGTRRVRRKGRNTLKAKMKALIEKMIKRRVRRTKTGTEIEVTTKTEIQKRRIREKIGRNQTIPALKITVPIIST